MKKKRKYLTPLLMLFLVLGITGCGAGHGSPESVVKSLIESYGEEKVSTIKDCYGVGKNDVNDTLQEEIDATLKYMKVHNMKKIEIVDCGTISENEAYVYVYITYNLVLKEDNQKYPCISTYMVTPRDKKYYVVSAADITSEMSAQAVEEYKEFMSTDAYKEYRRAYDTFVKKNPGYEDRIAEKMS